MRQLVVALTSGLLAGAGGLANEVVLETPALRLTLSDTAGGLADLVHRASGASLLSTPRAPDLFTIAFVPAEGQPESVGSSAAKRCELSELVGGDQPGCRLRFTDLPVAGLAVEVTVSVAEDPRLTLWTIAFDNPTGRAVAQVRFPSVRTPGVLGDGADPQLILPDLPGAKIVDPWTAWKPGVGARLSYPGGQSAQFLAFLNRQAGLFFGSRDGGAHPRHLEVFRRAGSFAFQHTYEASNTTAAHWESPYPAVMGVTQGDWFDAADLYKAWARRQAWCARPLAARDDIPAWLLAGPLVHVCEVRKYANRLETGSFYPELAEHLRVLRERVGGPVLLMPAGWENHRRWTAGDYFPMFDEPRAVEVLRQAREAGVRSFVFLSGLFYTFRNDGANGGDVPSAAEYRDAYVIDAATGQPKEYVLNESSGTTNWARHSYQFCVGAPQTKAFFRQVIDQLHERGIDVVQLDQTVSGGGGACGATSHQHPPGVGTYQTALFHDLLDDLRRYAKQRVPDFALLHEEQHEELIPHLDGFHMRDYKENFWYRGRPGSVGIPLFAYLYHEYALGYGGDSAPVGPTGAAWATRQHAVNLVTGKTPGISVWSSHANLPTSHPAPLQMVRQHRQLLETRARQHLLLGTMLHPLELNVPQASYKVPGQGGRPPLDIREPLVLTSSWQAPDGAVGHLLVNVSIDQPQRVAVDLDTRNATGFERADVDLLRPGAAPERLATATAVPYRLERELAPLEAVFVELRPSR